MDDFFSWVFCVLLTLCLATCVGCSMGGKKDISSLAEDIAELCGTKLAGVELDFDDDGESLDKLRVQCTGYGI